MKYKYKKEKVDLKGMIETELIGNPALFYKGNDMLLLVEGTFKGNNNIRSALLFYVKPFEVYSRDVGNNTIDDVYFFT